MLLYSNSTISILDVQEFLLVHASTPFQGTVLFPQSIGRGERMRERSTSPASLPRHIRVLIDTPMVHGKVEKPG